SVDLVLVVFLGADAVEPRPVHPGQREHHRRADRESTGAAAACTVVHSLRPPNPPRAICIVWSLPALEPSPEAAQLGFCPEPCGGCGACCPGSGFGWYAAAGAAESCGSSYSGAGGCFFACRRPYRQAKIGDAVISRAKVA